MGSISPTISALIFTCLVLTYIKTIEEKELEMRFGQDYLSYKSKTPFFFPGIFRKGKTEMCGGAA